MHPFATRPQDRVDSLGESALLLHLRRWLGSVNPSSPAGMGDDCALLSSCAGRALITVDPVVYGRHFDDTVPAAGAGAKLLNRNVSDIAAMGGRPTSAVISLLLPGNVSIYWIRGFYLGLARAARRAGVRIVGGDVAGCDCLSASLTLLGEAPQRPALRKGVRAGDQIWVTGPLGGSRLGHHFRFTPRLAEGRWLAAQPEVQAMMDISDGLAKDLRSLTPTGLWPQLDLSALPITAAARRIARQTGKPAWEHALTDGEDFELLFALRRGTSAETFQQRWRRHFPRPLHALGTWRTERERGSGSFDINSWQGYEHLRAT